jgi:hypothetical protein
MTAPSSTFGRYLARWHRAFGERPVTVAQADAQLRLGEARLRTALQKAHRRGQNFSGYMVRRGGFNSTDGLRRWRIVKVPS